MESRRTSSQASEKRKMDDCGFSVWKWLSVVFGSVGDFGVEFIKVINLSCSNNTHARC